MATLTGSSGVNVFLGQGDGTFSAAVTLPTNNRPLTISVGDLNNDGKPDLAVANYNSDNISVILNTSQ